jgi:uncharacterized protein (TIGR02453 family)
MEFYAGLEDDNSKSYWTSHKAVYEEKVLHPMTELLEQLSPEFGEPKIFRPYRDIRFSADKTPYKTHIGATLAGTAYVQLSADGLSAGTGRWQLDPPQLARYRAAVAAMSTGDELEAIIAVIEKAGHEVNGHGTLKSAPRGYPLDHPRIGLLRHKGLTSWQHWQPAPWLHTASAAQRLQSFFRTSAALVSWLDRNVSG